MQTTGIVMILIQIGFAIHAIRRGYPLFWVFLIVFLPLLGCILYCVMVLLPEAMESRAAQQGSRFLRKAIDPKKELRRRQQALEASDTVGNRVALADEYLRQGNVDEAIPLYEGALNGIYRTDPEILLGLAAALVRAGDFGRAKEVLETLSAANPEYDNPEARLLYARVLAEVGEAEEALAQYEALAESSSGPETKCRHALLLKQMGRGDEAKRLFAEIVKDAKTAGKHSNRLNKEWIDIARKEAGA